MEAKDCIKTHKRWKATLNSIQETDPQKRVKMKKSHRGKRKRHKRKLKMHGLGPYVINEITLVGVVHLETLDGEPLANSINGSCLKSFHEPLTP